MKVTETIREEPIRTTGVIKEDEEEVIDMPMIEEDSDWRLILIN